MTPRIEVLRQMNGSWLISTSGHSVEAADNDKMIDAAIDKLAADSGVRRPQIAVAVVRRQLADD